MFTVFQMFSFLMLGFVFFFLMFICFERERVSGGRAERERRRERILSRFHVVSTETDVALGLTKPEKIMI